MDDRKSDLVAKVPQVTLLFWIIKILATTLGETGGDAVTMSWLGETTSEAKGTGYLIGTEISRLVDKGYQKFLKTTKTEVPATADHLKALHNFSEELREALGQVSLYNESLGTVSENSSNSCHTMLGNGDSEATSLEYALTKLARGRVVIHQQHMNTRRAWYQTQLGWVGFYVALHY